MTDSSVHWNSHLDKPVFAQWCRCSVIREKRRCYGVCTHSKNVALSSCGAITPAGHRSPTIWWLGLLQASQDVFHFIHLSALSGRKPNLHRGFFLFFQLWFTDSAAQFSVVRPMTLFIVYKYAFPFSLTVILLIFESENWIQVSWSTSGQSAKLGKSEYE